MRRLVPALLLALLAACGGGAANNSASDANAAAEEGGDLNMAIGGDELSPIPEAEDDMIANDTASGNGATPEP